ncbi:MBOAT family protein [Candidatus Peregrinibacteria bacterium]|nr:MBOAT family protein [Candidatus Peregrinibacteria bacterium]
MLFHSFSFLFVFLPLAVMGFFTTAHIGGRRIAILWLIAASLFFYAWWNPVYILLLFVSIITNYLLGVFLQARERHRKSILFAGISFNLLLLGYFKYANFFVDTLDALTGIGWNLSHIVLPLGISFFTFQKIAYLVDIYQRKTVPAGFLDYCLFVAFFPQLIAGPIVHHAEMIPQFKNPQMLRFSSENIAVGLTILLAGLAKKVIFADTIAAFATPVFAASARGATIAFPEAWGAALAYTLQLYFDFSGYTDMAIGSARLFGLHLPSNFNAPYVSVSIVDFWRRWHITLSRFLRQYVYVPLGGNRKGRVRTCINLFVTLLVGGVWHGAGWTFVVWGALHGTYLVINHAWSGFRKSLGHAKTAPSFLGTLAGRTLTFLAIVCGWVLFRAENLASAGSMLLSMSGMRTGLWNELIIPGAEWRIGAACIVFLLLVVWCAPTLQQWMCAYYPAFDEQASEQTGFLQGFCWSPTPIFALALAIVTILSLTFLTHHAQSEFLYFQF